MSLRVESFVRSLFSHQSPFVCCPTWKLRQSFFGKCLLFLFAYYGRISGVMKVPKMSWQLTFVIRIFYNISCSCFILLCMLINLMSNFKCHNILETLITPETRLYFCSHTEMVRLAQVIDFHSIFLFLGKLITIWHWLGDNSHLKGHWETLVVVVQRKKKNCWIARLNHFSSFSWHFYISPYFLLQCCTAFSQVNQSPS